MLRGALTIHQVNGVDDRWSDTQKLNLTYCVSTGFGASHGAVVEAMAAAAADWESAARINFIHLASEDGACDASNPRVVFDVRLVAGQSYLARAFFPSTPHAARNVLIDQALFEFSHPWTLGGILRHELGHVLGFRHEHTRPEAGMCFENTSWREVTPYDSDSVMHYPHCNGSNDGDLVLTGYDRQGAALVYQPPIIDDAFTIVNPDSADALKGDETNLIPGDFNGDGLTDLLRQEKNNWDDDSTATSQVWLSEL